MGLYLAIFEDEEELDGLEVGSYADFGRFRDAVTQQLERGKLGSRFPTLVLHSDCDGEWTPAESVSLITELATIRAEFANLPPILLDSWQKEVAKTLGINLKTLADCFFDVDGEPLLDRLVGLAETSQKKNLPILFQ